MKKILLLAAVATFAVTSCSKENPGKPDDGLVAVQLGAKVLETRAAVNSGEAFSAQVIASATTNDYTTLYSSGETPADFNQAVAFAADKSATLNPSQYYPADGSSIYVMGYAPVDKADSVVRTDNTVAFTINGSNDIMVSNQVSGNKSTPIATDLTFGHLLTQLQFKVIAEDGAAVGIWGDVTKIEILAQDTKFDLTLADGKLAPNATPANGAIVAPGSAATLAETAATAGYAMIYPMADLATTALKLKVYTTNFSGGQEVSLAAVGTATTPVTALAEGSAYTVTLNFKAQTIAVTGTATDWVDAEDETVDLE